MLPLKLERGQKSAREKKPQIVGVRGQVDQVDLCWSPQEKLLHQSRASWGLSAECPPPHSDNLLHLRDREDA